MTRSKLSPVAPAVAGFSLPELLVSATLIAVIAAGLLTTLTALQKSASASQHHATSQLSQARIMDYISRDLRRALSVVVDSTEGGERLTVTIPEYRGSDGMPRDPAIIGDSVSYGSAGSSITVTYYRRAGVFYRSVNGVETALA